MSEDLTQLQLQETRRALSLCTGERDRAREEARQLRAQLRSLRAELQAVRPVEQSELLAAQDALRQAQAQTLAAQALQLEAEAEREGAQTRATRAETQTQQARLESDMSLERVIELREELTRLRSNRAIDQAAVSLLRAQLDAVRTEVQAPSMPPTDLEQSKAPQPEERTQVVEEAVQEPEGKSPHALIQAVPQATQTEPNPTFDLPEGAIWEFEGVAEPEQFMHLCLELCGRAAGDYLRIGYFKGTRKKRAWRLVAQTLVWLVREVPSDETFLVGASSNESYRPAASDTRLVRVGGSQ